MHIVILDGYSINPGDLNWSSLETFGNLTVYDRSAPEEVQERSAGAEIVLTNKSKIPGDVIHALPQLRYIGELATGYDNVDIETAAKRNIPVCNVPGYSTSSVAQLTWALILELTYNINRRSNEVHNGAWTRSKDFCFGHEGLFELQGKTLGLIGLGQIGSAVAKIGMAFGMKIVATVRNPAKYDMPGVSFASVNECFAQADFVSLHCPLTDANREMVNKELIERMKPTAYLINTARGALVNEQDLAGALNHKQIAGAAVDVLSLEPPPAGNPLLKASNCIITPHIAWATRQARERLLYESAENIKTFLNGGLRNVVNGVKKV
ncbi:D-2-hydroxyacid dehydrogenase [Agriterribacter sp.]|uniref:D-2-hydroxyacid dehydrogenase n=1 Tax=Agriterribacter sp. TaxID=2821509 RepID=UPI002CC12D80|nr:D-2-hydroxyacid dehydrogenase [Agriterribacter sp.]HRO45518.1 D-2-hydroxyacid dehydrogenase [Agriterribacter sp.]HRQ19464.1 D-2-hydroxyacid dehydrogenase [Agriterribacter sp.]